MSTVSSVSQSTVYPDFPPLNEFLENVVSIALFCEKEEFNKNFFKNRNKQ